MTFPTPAQRGWFSSNYERPMPLEGHQPAVTRWLQAVRPCHETNYLDSEGITYNVLTELKAHGLRITKEG